MQKDTFDKQTGPTYAFALCARIDMYTYIYIYIYVHTYTVYLYIYIWNSFAIDIVCVGYFMVLMKCIRIPSGMISFEAPAEALQVKENQEPPRSLAPTSQRPHCTYLHAAHNVQ